MAFGKTQDGWDFERFDSKSEESCFRALERLIPERILKSVIAHPHLAGLDVDFLVVFPKGRLCAVEFDGLGAARRSDLGPRVVRLHECAAIGIETRWLTSYDDAYVRAQMTHYKPPVFSRVRSLCTCGRHSERIVIAPAPFTENAPCHACA